MSDSPDINTNNENMIQQGPPLVNPQNTSTSAQANNVIVPTPPASPAPIHPPRLERRNNSSAPVLMRTDSVPPPRLERRNNSRAPVLMRSHSVHHVVLERTEPNCPDLMLDTSDFDYDSVLEPNPNSQEIFDPSIFRYIGYGPVLERSDSIRHTGAADTSDSIQPSILTRSGFIPPPTLIRNDSRPVINNEDDDGPPPLIRLCPDTFPHVYDFPSDDEYDVVQRDNFEWFPPSSSSQP